MSEATGQAAVEAMGKLSVEGGEEEMTVAARAQSVSEELDLRRYEQLQERVAELGGMMIPTQLAALKRRTADLERELAAVPDAAGEEGGGGKAAELRLQLARNASNLGMWQDKAAELAAAQREVKALEAVMFKSRTQEGAQRKREMLDALCALDDEAATAAEKAAEESEESEEAAAPKAKRVGPVHFLKLVAQSLTFGFAGPKPTDKYGRYGRGRLVRIAAGKLQQALEGKELEVVMEGDEEEGKEGGEEGGSETASGSGEAGSSSAAAPDAGKRPPPPAADNFGRYGRGRMVRIAAGKMKAVAAARNAEKQRALQRMSQVAGAHSGVELTASQEMILAGNVKFNPVLDCPLSSYLWPYRSRFMGPLRRLQTGKILQAFYRFGPFDPDPTTAAASCPKASSGASATRLPPLILLPGMGATMICWGVPLLRALSATHEVIIMEYAGAGLSKDTSGIPWDYYKQAEAVLLLSDALQLHHPNVLGWSSGGNIGLVLAALHGNRIGRVASLAGMAGGKNTIVPPTYELLNPHLQVALPQVMGLIFPPDLPDFKEVTAEYIKSVFSMPGGITDQSVGAKTAAEQWVADQEFIHRDERVWDALPGVTTPVLIMNGDQDVLVPPENARRIAARVPTASPPHIFPGWGHGFKDVDAFVEVINAFLLEETL